MRILTAAALVAGLVGAQDARATSCEHSAARVVPCPAGREAPACLLVGDNEIEEQLLLYALDARAQLTHETPVAIGAKLGDIEAIEVAGDRIWIVGSHGRKRWRDELGAGAKQQCAVAGKRLAIFAGTMTREGAISGTVTKTKKKAWKELLRAQCESELFQLDAADAKGRALAKQACAAFAANDENANQRRDACENAFNIEGAAAIPGTDGVPRLWLGLRSPTLDGKALLLRWKPGDTLRFDGIASVALGERRGVRDMAWAKDRLWLLAGPVPDFTAGVAFALESAPVASLESGAELAAQVTRPVRERAEGLAIMPDGTRASIVTDGAQGDATDAACKVAPTFFTAPLD
jgi:hypothetical protein